MSMTVGLRGFRRTFASLLVWSLTLSLLLIGIQPTRVHAAGVTLSPSSAAAGYSLPISVTATGSSTAFVDGGTNVTMVTSAGTPVNAVSGVDVEDADTLTFQIATGVSQGDYTIRISYPTGEVSTAFTVTSAATVSLSQASISAGYTPAFTITATGTNTHFATGQTTVSLLNSGGSNTGATSSVTIGSATSLTFSLATGLTQGSYTLQIATGGETVTTPFTVKGSPLISLNQPSMSLNYTTALSMAVTGTNTHFASGQTTVSVRDSSGSNTGTASSVSVASATSLTFSIATGLTAGAYTVRVISGSETVSTAFTITDSASISLSQAEISQGYSSTLAITVTGTNTHFTSGSSTVTMLLGDQSAGSISGTAVASATSLSLNLGTGLTQGGYTLKVVTGAETVTTPFTVTGAASGTLSPVNVAQGYTTSFSLTATGTNTHFADGQTTVALVDSGGESTGTITNTNVTNAASLSFTLGTGLTEGSYTVQIVTGAETVEIPFPVTAAAAGTLNTAEVAAGYTSSLSLTVTGQRTHFVTGSTTVSLVDGSGTSAGTISNTNVASATSLSFSLGTGLTAGAYTLKIVTGAETVSIPFTVTAAASLSLSPSGTAAGYGSTSVSVTGTNTHFVQGTTTVAVLDGTGAATGTAGSATVGSATALTFTLASGNAAGDYTVRVTTGVEQAETTFTVSQAATISISPNSVAAGYSENVSIAVTGVGTNFLVNPQVSIKDATPTEMTGYALNVSASSQTALSFSVKTGLSAGTYTVNVSYSGGNPITATLTVEADVTAPVLTFTAPSATPFYKGGSAITTTLSATDNAAGIAADAVPTVTFNGAAVTNTLAYTSGTEVSGTISGTVTLPSDISGTYALVVGLSDRMSNAGSATRSLKLDNTAPTLTYTSPALSSPYKKGDTVLVEITVTDGTGAGVTNGAAITATLAGIAATNTLSYSSTTGKITGTVTPPNGVGSSAAALLISISDSVGNSGSASLNLNVDTVLPTWTGATLTTSNLTASGVTLTWSGATDNVGVANYKIYRGGVLLDTIAGSLSSYDVTGLSTATQYNFSVQAQDAVGNISTGGPSVSATTLDSAKPAFPDGATLTSAATQTGLRLTWTAATDNVAVTAYRITKNGTQIAELSGATTTYDVTDLTSGTQYTFTVEAVDEAANASDTDLSLTVTAMPLSPSVSITAPSGSTWYKGGQSFAVTATVGDSNAGVAAGATVSATLGGGSVSHTLTYTRTNATTGQISGNVTVPSSLSTGTHSLVISVADQIGNLGQATKAIKVDNAAPILTFTSPASGSTYKKGDTIAVTIAVSDSGSGVADAAALTVTLNSAAVTNTLAYSSASGQISGNVTVPDDLGGSYALAVAVADQLALTGSTSRNFTIDSALPTWSAAKSLSTSAVTATGLTLTWTGDSDNVGVTQYKVYRGGVEIATVSDSTTYDVTGLTTATEYTFAVQAVDAAGNATLSGPTVTATTLDNAKPSWTNGSLTATPSATGFALSWTAAADNVGVTAYKLYQNDLLVTTLGGGVTSYDASNLTVGTQYTFGVESLDLAGNVSDTRLTTTITAGTTAPTLSFTAPAGTEWYKSGDTVTVAVTAADSNAGVADAAPVTVTFGGQAVANTLLYARVDATSGQITGTVTVPDAVASGTHSLAITIADQVGNTGQVTKGIKVDNTAAALAYTQPAAGTTYKKGDTIAAVLTVTDADSGVADGAALTVTLNGAAVANTLAYSSASGQISGNVTVPDNLGGTYALVVILSDQAGNPASGSLDVTVDSAVPTWQSGAELATSGLGQSSVTLSWTAANDNVAVSGYRIYREATLLQTAAASATSYAVTGLSSSTAYTFAVKAIDAAGNASEAISVDVTTSAPSGGGGGGGSSAPVVDPVVDKVVDPVVDPVIDPVADPVTAPDTGTDIGSGTPDTAPVLAPEPEVLKNAVAEVQADGTTAIVTQVRQSDLTAKALAGGLTIDLTAETAPVSGGTAVAQSRLKAAEVPVSVLSQLDDQNQAIVVDAGIATLSFPAGALTESDAVRTASSAGPAPSVKITVQEIDTSEPASSSEGAAILRLVTQSVDHAKSQGLIPAGKLIAFNATVTSGSAAGLPQAVTSFNAKITVTIPFDEATNPNHVGVYRLNRSIGEWEYRGGKVDLLNRTVTVELDSLSEYTVMEYSRSFADVSATHWAKADIELMASRHIAKGTDNLNFSPSGDVTRAQFAALLARTLGLKPYIGTSAAFSDVQVTDWFAGEVNAAAQSGLLQGDQGKFRPNDKITRQEIAVVLWRALALRKKGISLSPLDRDLQLMMFSDLSQIASWARSAAADLVKLKIITGRSATTYNPVDSATRAEAAVVLKRLLQQLGEL